MENRTHRVFTDEDIQKVADTACSWRKGEGYKDVQGFCKSSTNEEIDRGSKKDLIVLI